jgi:hypothetical protein
MIIAAPIAGAQVMRVPQRSSIPVVWGSLSAGFLQFDRDIVDGRTESVWRWGSALSYRGSVEMDVGNSGSAGVAVSMADAPLTYESFSGTAPAQCSPRCDAHAQVWTIMANFHMGGGVGFHQIINLSAGTTVYRDFRTDADGTTLEPSSPDKDISLAIGYGFGWGFGTRTQLMLVQDAAYTLHQRDGLSGNQNSNSTLYTTRLGLRIGLGNKAR